jgi:glycine/D-amino acid oxidase-like deaminating enzyme
LPSGSLTIGGFRDQGGPGEWSLDARPMAPVQELLEAFVRTHLGVSAPITHRWAACAGYTESGLPVLEQVREGVWALGGYSGTGNVIGALSGRAVVAAALDDKPAPARVLHGPQWRATVTGGRG